MTAKIFKSIFISSLVAFTVALVISLLYSYSYYDEEVERELYREASYIKNGIDKYGDGYIDTVNTDGIRLTVVESDGRVSYDSHVFGDGLAELGNQADREEIRDALAKGEGYSVRRSDTIAEETVYYAIRLSDGRVLRVSYEHRTALSIFLDSLGTMSVMLVIITALAFFIARGLSASIVRPINELNLNAPENAEIYDELKPIVGKLVSQNRRISLQMAELRMREEEFVSITSNMNEGMIVINARTIILSCNESAMRILGAGENMPKSALGLNSSDGFREAISAALGGTNGYDELTVGEKHYSIIATPVFHDSAVEGAVILIIDDTEKEQREQLRREFTSNISHELKTPLTSISGFAELIRCGMAEGEEAKHFADNIYKEAKRLVTLVGDIIRLTRLDGREIPYDGEVDLYDIAGEVAARLENVAASAGVEISVSGEHLKVLGNEEILEEMVYNLSDNAIKYNRPGGFVKINISESSGQVALSVEDNGIGIPRDKQDRVFERFYRVDKSHSKEIGGTGLGLSIVKHAAGYHKAEISLESEEGVGTEITVKFPAIEAV